jgi:hypothetical protein
VFAQIILKGDKILIIYLLDTIRSKNVRAALQLYFILNLENSLKNYVPQLKNNMPIIFINF